MLTTLLLALAGTVIALIVGSFWYSNATPMGKLHMRYIGFDKLSEEEKKKKIEEAMPKMWKTYAMQFMLSFLTSFAVVYVVTLSVQNGVPLTMAALFPLMSWLCFVVPTVGMSILWGNCEPSIALKKFISDTTSNLVTILLIILLTSFFI